MILVGVGRMEACGLMRTGKLPMELLHYLNLNYGGISIRAGHGLGDGIVIFFGSK